MAFLVSEVYESDCRSRYQVMHHLEVMHSAYFNNDTNVIFFILLKKKTQYKRAFVYFPFVLRLCKAIPTRVLETRW